VLQGNRFADTTSSQDAQRFARHHVEAYIVEDLVRSKRLGDSTEFNVRLMRVLIVLMIHV
jgi:hypothetical protein